MFFRRQPHLFDGLAQQAVPRVLRFKRLTQDYFEGGGVRFERLDIQRADRLAFLAADGQQGFLAQEFVVEGVAESVKQRIHRNHLMMP
jgi:hypothetical protein